MKFRVVIGFLVAYFFSVSFVIAQNDTFKSEDYMKPVFIIGEYEEAYEFLISTTKSNLYEVCDNSMETAFGAWQDMLVQISKFAKEEELDIDGVKIWMNTFWNEDGTIKHIVFYPKLNSKNIDFSKLTSMLTKFLDDYQLPYTSDSLFAHYGQATFPVQPVRVSNTN